jgi:DNA invertase Pin-like site-specific DNA recombinase
MTKYGYSRVSSQEQAIGGMSINVQVDRLKALGINKIFIDAGKSAGVKEDMVEYQFDGRHFKVNIDLNNRPEFMKMMGILKPMDELWFLRFDRISRNFHFLESFINWCDRKGVILKPIDDSTHKLTRRILSVIAQEELEKTAIRNDDISKGIYDRGGFAYRSPIGYDKNIKTPKGLRFPNLPESSLIPNNKAPMVKDIFNQMSKGVHYKKICEEYHINSQTLYTIVRNRVYLGITSYKGLEKKTDLIQPLIDEETFRLANLNIKSGNSQNIKRQDHTR